MSKAARPRFGHHAGTGVVFGGAILVAVTFILAPARSYAALDPLGGPAYVGVEPTLQQRIAAQDALIATTERMKQELHEPKPVWATERSALPRNHREIEAYRERIAILEHDLDTARRKRAALAAALHRSPDVTNSTTQQEDP